MNEMRKLMEAIERIEESPSSEQWEIAIDNLISDGEARFAGEQCWEWVKNELHGMLDFQPESVQEGFGPREATNKVHELMDDGLLDPRMVADACLSYMSEAEVADMADDYDWLEKHDEWLGEGDDDPCWDNYQMVGMKKKDGKEVPNCVPESVEEYTIEEAEEVFGSLSEELTEAEYQGRKVELNKPMQGDVKKFKVYVKNPKGNVVKVNFGEKGAKIKKDNPERRKSFRARHNCDNPGPKHKARYWSCRKW